MPIQSYQIVTGVVITIMVFLFIGFFVFILLVYISNKKRRFKQEKKDLEILFNQQILQSQLEIQEQTFNIISQEIHDNVGQSLSLAKVQLNIMDRGEILDKALLAETKESVGKAMSDLRDIAKSLNSERIKQSSLIEIINQELSRINRSGLLLANIKVAGKEQKLQEQKKLIVFRVVQEALQNILKHAEAKNVEVYCQYQNEHLQLSIIDDGKGFDKKLLFEKDGLGLQNIVNRASLIGGTASIDSKTNEGTTITIITPYV